MTAIRDLLDFCSDRQPVPLAEVAPRAPFDHGMMTHMTDPNGAAIYGVPWIPSRNTPFMLAYVSIYGSTMDPSWVMI